LWNENAVVLEAKVVALEERFALIIKVKSKMLCSYFHYKRWKI
jgi:hypothetical protein